MRNNFVWAIALVLVLSAGGSRADQPSDAKIHQDTHQLKKDYQRKVDKDLRSIGKRIRHLERQVQRTGDRAKAGLDKDLRTLRYKKAEADRKFIELKKSTGDAWKDMRKGLDDAVADLKRAVDDASNRMKGDK